MLDASMTAQGVEAATPLPENWLTRLLFFPVTPLSEVVIEGGRKSRRKPNSDRNKGNRQRAKERDERLDKTAELLREGKRLDELPALMGVTVKVMRRYMKLLDARGDVQIIKSYPKLVVKVRERKNDH